MTSNSSANTTCTFCNFPAPRLYVLPPRVATTRTTAGPACYFCFIKMTGIKPNRSRLSPTTAGSDGSASV